jgi:mannose-6-phosphate isomerase-like protein (cupin superfamily)
MVSDERLDEAGATQQLQREGLSPHAWGNAPGDTYGWHEHEYEKVLYCVEGSIVFHTRDGDRPLSAGDRMELPARTHTRPRWARTAAAASRRRATEFAQLRSSAPMSIRPPCTRG